MTETHRTSGFIDFNAGAVHATPDTFFSTMPELWSIVDRFPTFIARLKDPQQKDLRQKFEEIVDEFPSAPPTKVATRFE